MNIESNQSYKFTYHQDLEWRRKVSSNLKLQETGHVFNTVPFGEVHFMTQISEGSFRRTDLPVEDFQIFVAFVWTVPHFFEF